MRRTDAANADLRMAERGATATAEDSRLFLEHQRARHGDSDMARMTAADLATTAEDGSDPTRTSESRDAEGSLLAVLLTDRLEDSFASSPSYYPPPHPPPPL